MITRSLTLSVILAFAACGGDNGGTPDARTAPTADAASIIDASGNAADAADSTDAAATNDGGNADAASGMDGATGDDAALSPDAFVGDGGTAAGPVINEAVLDHNSGSDTMEYIEVKGDPTTDLSAYTVIQVDGDIGGNGPGYIVSVHPVGTTGANGYWWTGYMANQLQDGTQTLLLVRNFTGAVGDDVDTNDDGVIDATPWDAIVDGVGFNDQKGSGNFTYAGGVELPAMSSLSNPIGGASRIPDGVDTDSAADWTPNVYDMSATPAAGEAFNTPDAVNAAN